MTLSIFFCALYTSYFIKYLCTALCSFFLLYVYCSMHICVRLFECDCGSCNSPLVVSEDNSGCQVLPSVLFGTESPAVCHQKAGLGFPCLCLPSCYRTNGATSAILSPSFTGSGFQSPCCITITSPLGHASCPRGSFQRLGLLIQ